MPKRVGRPARILIVEDNLYLRELLTEYTGLLGYDSMLVIDGEQALATAAVWQPDLVICDVGLPGMSGVEVCARLKASLETQQTPVLLITGLGEDEGSHIREAGAESILWKPFELDDLQAEISRLLAGRD